MNVQKKIEKAVRSFWGTRRAGVTAGKNMDGFIQLLLAIVRDFDLKSLKIHQEHAVLTLPGFFRPTKRWDLLIMNDKELIAAIELKSQVGPSFGNNFNNRAEEAIGTACDFWTAYRKGAFGKQPPPFIGWLALVEDAPESRKIIRDRSPHFAISPDFQGASYLQRYDLLCQKMMLERLYSSAAVITSSRSAVLTGAYSSLSTMSSIDTFIASLSGHISSVKLRPQ